MLYDIREWDAKCHSVFLNGVKVSQCISCNTGQDGTVVVPRGGPDDLVHARSVDWATTSSDQRVLRGVVQAAVCDEPRPQPGLKPLWRVEAGEKRLYLFENEHMSFSDGDKRYCVWSQQGNLMPLLARIEAIETMYALLHSHMCAITFKDPTAHGLR